MIYNDLAIFVAVARNCSFSRAALELDVPASSVSRRIGELEAALDARLFERTTRNVRLTQEGRALLDRTEAPIEDLNSVVRAGYRDGGTIRITAPPLAARTAIGHALLDFLAQNPEVRIELLATNARLDFIRDNIDVAFRLGPLFDSDLIATKLWEVPYSVCASPGLVEQHGGLEAITAERLPDLPTVSTGQNWRFEGIPNLELRSIAHHIDELDLACQAVQRGLGFGYLPDDLAERAGGKLAIAGLKPTPHVMYAVHPARRLLSRRTRALIDHLRRYGRGRARRGSSHAALA